jgi:hypothetical protein
MAKVHSDADPSSFGAVFRQYSGAANGYKSDNNKTITSIVVDRLQSNSQLRGSGIDVETKDREVALKGVVNSRAGITEPFNWPVELMVLGWLIAGLREGMRRSQTLMEARAAHPIARSAPIGPVKEASARLV